MRTSRIGRIACGLVAAWLLTGFVCTGGESEAADRLEVEFTGRIKDVDVDRATIIVADPEHGETLLNLTEDSEIVLDGDAEAIVEDLFEDDYVEYALAYRDEDGEWILLQAAVTSVVDDLERPDD